MPSFLLPPYARLCLLIAFLICSVTPASFAAESASPSFKNTRSSLNESGQKMTSPSFKMDSTLGEVGLTTHTSSSFLSRTGLIPIYHYPGKVTGLSASTASAEGQILLEWTAPGNDGYETGSSAKSYLVKFSSTAAESPALSDTLFNTAQEVSNPPVPSSQGTLQSMTVTSLQPAVTYYFAIKAREADFLTGTLSGGATAQATQFGVNIVELTFDAGSLSLGVSSVSASALTLINTGNAGETYRLRASTVTSGSPWFISTDGTSGTNELVLKAVFHSSRPSESDFESGTGDLVTESFQASQTASGGGRYTVNDSQTGVSVHSGQQRDLWFMFTPPTISSTTASQTIRVFVEGQ